MPTRSRSQRDAAGRAPTAAGLGRRRQILDATIAVIARSGWAAGTLQAVADELGVTKAAVIYHVGTKAELVRQAYDAVIESFVEYVSGAVEEATDPLDAVERFARAHLDYMREHPDHARVIVEVLGGESDGDSPSSPGRAVPLAGLITAARSGDESAIDATVLATVIAGAIDGSVQAWLDDPAFDLDAADLALVALIRAAV
jgi:TetR/AcrR family transcriptional regulator